MSEQTTRERILSAAEEIMLERSFHSVGLKQILDMAKVPKGSFYHYFNSKEQFGVEMLKAYMDEATDIKRQILTSKSAGQDPVTRLFALLDRGIEATQSVAGKFPCLALKLASEVSDLSEPMRAELAKGFEQWIVLIRETLEEAREEGILSESIDSAKEAQLIHDLMTGSTHRAVINRNSEPVVNAVKHIKSRIEYMRTG